MEMVKPQCGQWPTIVGAREIR